MTYQIFTLDNGIRLIHKQTNGRVAHCGLTINAGSRDEKTHQQGLAHFIEHVIFKGTKKRRNFHILSNMENVGGEINAYTTKEDTTIYASFMSTYYERWFDLLSDIVFNSVFPEKELLKEKDIIIDEINSYKDSPGEQIFDDFDQLIFPEHPLGRNILGTPRHIRSFTSKDIIDFIASNYATEEMVICSVGNIDFSRLIKLSQKYFAHVPFSGAPKKRTPVTHYQPEHKTVKRRNHQTHCMLGNQAYDANHKLKTTMVLLNNMLGGPGLNSRLNMAIREKHGFCYNIESHYQPYSDTGIFSIYFGTDRGFSEKTLDLIKKELNRFRENSLGSLQLQRAKNQLTGQVAISHESNVNEMLSLGKSLIVYNEVDTIEQINKKIEQVTASDILQAANEVFNLQNMSMLKYSS